MSDAEKIAAIHAVLSGHVGPLADTLDLARAVVARLEWKEQEVARARARLDQIAALAGRGVLPDDLLARVRRERR